MKCICRVFFDKKSISVHCTASVLKDYFLNEIYIEIPKNVRLIKQIEQTLLSRILLHFAKQDICFNFKAILLSFPWSILCVGCWSMWPSLPYSCHIHTLPQLQCKAFLVTHVQNLNNDVTIMMMMMLTTIESLPNVLSHKPQIQQ